MRLEGGGHGPHLHVLVKRGVGLGGRVGEMLPVAFEVLPTLFDDACLDGPASLNSPLKKGRRSNILKRLLIHVAGFNLSLIMRKMLGAGTPRGVAALVKALRALAKALLLALGAQVLRFRRCHPTNTLCGVDFAH